MESKLVRKTLIDKITQLLIDNGKTAVDVLSSPLSAYKIALELIEQRNDDKFINQVLSGVLRVDIESLDAVKSLQRLYKATRVVSFATTQSKINRFKQLTINGIIQQEELSDSKYDIFLRITDEITDEEYIYLKTLVDNIPKSYSDDYDTFRDKYNEVLKVIKQAYQYSDDMILFLRNSLNGRGLVNLIMTYGGLELGKINELSYEYVQFIEHGGL